MTSKVILFKPACTENDLTRVLRLMSVPGWYLLVTWIDMDCACDDLQKSSVLVNVGASHVSVAPDDNATTFHVNTS